MESDCLQLVTLLASSSRSLASFGAVLDSCLEFVFYFDTLVFTFIRRSGNMLAHRLATDLVVPCSEGVSLLRKLRAIMNEILVRLWPKKKKKKDKDNLF